MHCKNAVLSCSPELQNQILQGWDSEICSLKFLYAFHLHINLRITDLTEMSQSQEPIQETLLTVFSQVDQYEMVNSTHALFFFFNVYIFIYFWLCWVFIAACRLSLVAASGGYSSLQCSGFSLRWVLLLRSIGSRHTGSVVAVCRLSSCGSWALEHRLSSCGTQAQWLRSMWDLPGPGI